MPFTPATPRQQPTYQKMRFDGTVEQATEIALAINTSLTGRQLVRCSIEGVQEGDAPPQWRIKMQRPDGTPEFAAVAGMVVVLSSLGQVRALKESEYQSEFQDN